MAKKKWVVFNKTSQEGEDSSKQLKPETLKKSKGTIEKTVVKYTVNGLWNQKVVRNNKSYDIFELPGGGKTNIEGYPELPTEGILIAVPDGATNIKLKVTATQKTVLKGKYLINPAPKILLEIQYLAGEKDFVINPAVYSSDTEYPGKYAELIGVKKMEGVSVAQVLIYPVQYKPKSGTVTVLNNMDIELTYSTSKSKNKILKGNERQVFVPYLNDLIIGYEKYRPDDTFPFEKELKVTKDLRKYLEGKIHFTELRPELLINLTVITELLSIKYKKRNSELIIITTKSLRDAVEPYRAARSYSPFNAMVVTTESISTEFPALSLKQSIKNYIQFAFDNYTVRPRYIVLAGDTDIIPIDVVTRGDHSYANDHYYVDLAGSLAPELIISRIPTSDFTIMQNVCRFFAEYYNLRGADWNGDWLNKVSLVAYQDSTYKNCSDDINNKINKRFTSTKLYGGLTTKADVVNNVNAGALLVNYRGHGSETAWSSSNGLNTTDISALNVGSKIPLVFNICCQNGHVDDTATKTVVEAFIRDKKAIACFGSSRDSWTSANNDFNKYIFDSVMEGEVSAGRIFHRSKAKLVINHSTSSTHMDNLVMYNLFGDPTANVVSSADFLRGLWDMEHDGWKGVLNIKNIHTFFLDKIGDCYYPVWYFSGEYTGSGGGVVSVNGKIGGKDDNEKNPGCKQSRHRIEFYVKFSPANNQQFCGYLFTWNKSAMAGLTWWSNHPFGFYAKKRS